MNDQRRLRQSINAVNLGLSANIVLAVLKTTTGIFGHSSALLSDGINSMSDVAYYIVVRIFVGLAQKPPDREHPYGHHQMESIAALVVGAFVLTTAVAIFWDSVNKVFDMLTGVTPFSGASAWALWVALFTVGSKVLLTQVTARIGRQTENAAVSALAYDHRNDAFAASGATLGIFLGRAGFPWVDPLAGALVALIILRTGIEIVRTSSSELMDTVPGKRLHGQIVRLLKNTPGVQIVEETQAHRFGPYLVVNVTIGVDGSVSVIEGDAIATLVERRLAEGLPMLKRVHVHYHPVRQGAPQVPDQTSTP